MLAQDASPGLRLVLKTGLTTQYISHDHANYYPTGTFRDTNGVRLENHSKLGS